MTARTDLSKLPEHQFLAKNPFAGPLTTGFFYREKMRAIYRIAPARGVRRVLEIGGGESGLSALLFPHATVVNVDMEPRYAKSGCNRQASVQFLAGDAVALPFASGAFDVVTMFDVMEHVPDDRLAGREALRVLRPGGLLLITTPNERWRFPFYSILQPVCPSAEEVMKEWGHVRKGYALQDLEQILNTRCVSRMDFITAGTVLSHDFSFSRLPALARRIVCASLAPVTWLAYTLQTARTPGTETASAWLKPHSDEQLETLPAQFARAEIRAPK